MKPDLLFIYGTLLPACEPPSMRDVCSRLRPIGEATVGGRLYDLGGYPGLILGDNGSRVSGYLVSVNGAADVWSELDRYEGCVPEGIGLYRRVKTLARKLHSSEEIECNVYVYNRSVSGVYCIEVGCWRTHRGLKTA